MGLIKLLFWVTLFGFLYENHMPPMTKYAFAAEETMPAKTSQTDRSYWLEKSDYEIVQKAGNNQKIVRLPNGMAVQFRRVEKQKGVWALEPIKTIRLIEPKAIQTARY